MASNVSPAQLAQMPVTTDPSGGPSNLIDPETRGPLYIGVVSLFLAIAVICTGLRLYIRIIQHAVWWDDVSLVIGLLLTTARTALVFWLVQYNGLGTHTWDVSIQKFTAFEKNATPLAILTEPSFGFIKLGLLLLYFRLFSPNRVTKYGIYIGIAINFIFYTILMFLFIFSSTYEDFILNRAVAIFNVLSDFYILGLPMTALLKLQLRRSKQIGLCAIFLTGLLACAMSILGCVYRFNLPVLDIDITWDLLPVNAIVNIESYIGIVCACVPLFPALFKKSQYTHGEGLASSWVISLRSLRDTILRRSPRSSYNRQHSRDNVELGDGGSTKDLVPGGNGYFSNVVSERGNDHRQVDDEMKIEVQRDYAVRTD